VFAKSRSLKATPAIAVVAQHKAKSKKLIGQISLITRVILPTTIRRMMSVTTSQSQIMWRPSIAR
jgi:hypothetical protein